MKRNLLRLLAGASLALALAYASAWIYGGAYGVHHLLRNGGGYWLHMKPDDPRLSPVMRLALSKAPDALPGELSWRVIDAGFEAGELPVIAGGVEVDRIMLARIDPARFRFELRNAPAGDKGLDEWMGELGAALVINGSYFSRHATPVTPFLSNGRLSGPRAYDARAGAFVAAGDSAHLRDLAGQSWEAAFAGAENAMVSYPLLLAENGESRVPVASRWLANRSFIGQDRSGRIILGTTADAFFSLDRLAAFLRAAPLGLRLALNLDGGPVACQGIELKGFARRVYGRWEMRARGDDISLLVTPFGTSIMPIVLAVFPR
jgi:hypothetical protein